MGAPRRAGPAALAAALIGAGLLLYRPRLVPELAPGPRARPSSETALASAIAWPAAPAPRPAVPAAPPAPAEEVVDAEEVAAWRDALADRSFSAVDHAAAGARPAPDRVPAAGPRETPAGAASPPRSLHDAVVGLLRAASRRETRPEPGTRPRPEAAAAREERRRDLLAVGPAPEDEDPGNGPSEARSRSGPAAARSAGPRRRAHFFPLFNPPRRAAAKPDRDSVRRRLVRPLLLSRMLGRGALRPPPASLVPPDLSHLLGRKPASLPDGSPVPARPYELDRVEAHDPRRAAAADRRRAPHWDEGRTWHDGPAQGVAADARWLWLWKEKARWWAAPEPEKPPLLRHGDLWWGKQRGVWFALHEGELWTWRRFADWDAEGLIRLADGVELVYSADLGKVAVITPGAGAVLYDARTGEELGEWREDEMPRRRPRAPAGLRLPRGI
ncbi:MAG: hypothetical protein HYX59_03170 [Elusimicrobia bacterium]|nr:hypothetical protein [Elusimicrobiota bacterium]